MLKIRTYIGRGVFLILGILNIASIHAEDLSAKISDYMDHLVEKHEFSGSVIVTKEGETIHSKGYGLANREHQLPNTPQTKFRVGSITKQFTAMAILILHEQGKLDLDDRIAPYIPNPPSIWSEITFHQLLTHTSGIMHSWALPGFDESTIHSTTLAKTIDRFKDQPLFFSPGESFKYSGVGYFILAQVIEQLTKETYEDALRQMIFTPLGMNGTGADHYKSILSHRATSYVRNEQGQLENAAYIYMPILTGGGNLYSTVEDLARWDSALSERRLISKMSYQRMYTPVKEDYAYGVVIGESFGHQEIFHGGRISGFESLFIRYPEQRICITILTNAQQLDLPGHDHVPFDLSAIVFGQSLEKALPTKTN